MQIHQEEKEGFVIKTYATPEENEPDFDDQEVLDQIKDGSLEWFMVRVTASKQGIELGTEYLGGCCYKTWQDFIKAGNYYSDMVDAAIKEAKETIINLTKD